MFLGSNHRRFRRIDETIVHLSNPTMAGLKTKNKIVVTLHDLYYYNSYSKSYLFSIFNRSKLKHLNRADAIITVSDFTKREALRLLPLDSDKIHTIYNSIDDIFYDNERSHMSEIILPIKEGDKLILHVGYDSPAKNVISLYKSLLKLPNKYKIIRVGKDMPSTVKFANSNSINNRIIRFADVEPNKLKWLYKRADMFVFPSLYEGFGRPVIEAMASGTPVISSKFAALPEVCGNAAVFIDPSLDDREMIDAIVSLGDSEMCYTLIEKGRERSKNFNHETQFKKLYRLYEELAP